MSRDLLSDSLTRIKNGQTAGHNFVTLDHSTLTERSVKVLHEQGYIAEYEIVEVKKNIKVIKVTLKYYRGRGVISQIKRISKNSRRIYAKIKEIRPKNAGLGIKVISTSKGILTDYEARAQGVGGEVLFEVF